MLKWSELVTRFEAPRHPQIPHWGAPFVYGPLLYLETYEPLQLLAGLLHVR